MKRTILKHKGKQIFYSLFPIFIILSFLLDNIIVNNMGRIHNTFFDIFFRLFSNVTIISLFIIAITIVMLTIKKDHKWIPSIFASMFITMNLVYYIKFLVERVRPHGIELITYFGLIDYSFPSAHTALIFSMIPILDKGFSHHKKLWVFLGIMVGLSRMYLGVHYLSDVLMGAFIGLIIGELILLLEKKYRWSTYISKMLWK